MNLMEQSFKEKSEKSYEKYLKYKKKFKNLIKIEETISKNNFTEPEIKQDEIIKENFNPFKTVYEKRMEELIKSQQLKTNNKTDNNLETLEDYDMKNQNTN